MNSKVILLILVIAVPGISQLVWDFKGEIYAGYNTNIFKSPETWSDGGEVLNPREDDMFRGIEADLGVRYYRQRGFRLHRGPDTL